MKTYGRAWAALFLGVVLAVSWSLYGRAYARQRFFGAPPIAEESRTQSQFVAILLPRIRPAPQKYAMSVAELKELLGGLTAAGHVSISLSDVEDLYARGRLLPPKAMLLAFSENDPRGYELADRVLKRLRLRGVAFIARSAEEASEAGRQYLTRHAMDQMRRSGGWEFGSLTPDGVLESSPGQARPSPLRFTASEMGLNDSHDDPRALRALTLRPDREVGKNVLIVKKSWPRETPLADDFSVEGFGTDWIPGWGVVSVGRRRMALLPTPRHTSAGVFLRGADKWRDMSVEFVLKRYQKEFWAYARMSDDGGFVRVGARNGYWYVEQKTSGTKAVNMLGRSPITEGRLPARVRMVLKGDSAIVYVNGRMLFGRALRLNPAVDRGRFFLGVYDGQQRSSMAVLTSVRASALGEVWVTSKDELSGFDEGKLDDLREEALSARVLSPRWIKVDAGGSVHVAQAQNMLIRSMADFYACRLVPTADLSVRASALGRGVSVDRLVGGLALAAKEMDAAGLNIRLRGEEARRPEMLAFFRKLHSALRAQKREIWITLDGAGSPHPALAGAADGVLKPSGKPRASLEILETATVLAAEPARQWASVIAKAPPTARQTVSRTQWEPARKQ